VWGVCVCVCVCMCVCVCVSIYQQFARDVGRETYAELGKPY